MDWCDREQGKRGHGVRVQCGVKDREGKGNWRCGLSYNLRPRLDSQGQGKGGMEGGTGGHDWARDGREDSGLRQKRSKRVPPRLTRGLRRRGVDPGGAMHGCTPERSDPPALRQLLERHQGGSRVVWKEVRVEVESASRRWHGPSLDGGAKDAKRIHLGHQAPSTGDSGDRTRE